MVDLTDGEWIGGAGGAVGGGGGLLYMEHRLGFIGFSLRMWYNLMKTC